MTREEIAKAFDFACEKFCQVEPRLREHAAQLVSFAKNHERRELCITNIQEQLQIFCSKRSWSVHTLQNSNAKNMKRRNLIIGAAAQIFILGIKEQRDQASLSEVQKSVLRNKDNIKNELSKILKEVPRYGDAPQG